MQAMLPLTSYQLLKQEFHQSCFCTSLGSDSCLEMWPRQREIQELGGQSTLQKQVLIPQLPWQALSLLSGKSRDYS